MEHGLHVVILALIGVIGTNLLAKRVPIPAPILQVLAGLALGFIPGIPVIRLDPSFVLLGVLPLLVYAAAVKLPWEQFRENIRPISMLAFGLVAATVAAVAAVAHGYAGLGWAAALVLGAIVSPTDPVAATAVASRVGVPQRLVAIIEGEGLVNDAVALTIKSVAIGALVGASVSAASGLLKFAIIVAGEIAYGLTVGWVVQQVRKRVEESSAEILMTLLTPFAAYLVPEMLGGSGVLATVAAGMYIGVERSEFVPSSTRLHISSVWDIVIYSLNGSLFLFTGLQFRAIVRVASADPGGMLLKGLAIAATAVAVRFAWTWIVPAVMRMVWPYARRQDRVPKRHLAFVAWSGMRGAISLAAALSIPGPVESRGMIVFLTACVIGVTLILQGSTLPWLIQLLHLSDDAREEQEREARQEAEARAKVTAAAVDALQNEGGDIAHEIRREFQAALARQREEHDARDAERETELRRTAISAERWRVIELHRNGEITDGALRRIERELDLEETLLNTRADD